MRQASETVFHQLKAMGNPSQRWGAVDKNFVVVHLFDTMQEAREWAKLRGLTTTVVNCLQLEPSTRVELEMRFGDLRVGDLFRSPGELISDITFRRIRGGVIFDRTGRLVSAGFEPSEPVVHIQE